MTKKIVMLSSIVLLIGSLFFLNNLHDNNFEILNSVSDKKAAEIRMTARYQEKLDFTCLLCNGSRVPIDDVSKTFYVTLNMEEAEWEKLEFASGQPEYEIVFSENIVQSDKKKAIAQGEKFEILVSDGTQWSEYYIVFSGLPIIDITTSEGFYSETITGNVAFYNTNFTSSGVTESEYQGHLRGNTSKLYPKKGYKLNLTKKTASGTTVNNKQAIFGMREDDDWILYAMYNDDTKIRDCLSIDLWNSFGARAVNEKSTYGTNMTYVEVFADNSYCGLYGLMEPIDTKQLNLSASDYLYKRRNSGSLDYEVFNDQTDPLANVQGFEIKSGVLDEEAWAPMAELSRIIALEDSSFKEEIFKVVDIDSAMRMWLFMQIITGHDQTAKNVYYVARNNEEGYCFTFAPWDMDLTWGNVSVGEENPLYTAFETETYDDWVHWETADRIIAEDIEGAMGNMQRLYLELRNSILSEQNIEQHIESIDTVIRNSGAYGRDLERWPEAAHTESCEQLMDYAKARLEFLDNALFDFELFDD